MNICIDAHIITLVGGLERFQANLANAMARRGHDVSLFTFAPQGSRPHFDIDPAVSVVYYLFSGYPEHIPGLRRQILACRPDVFVSPASYNNHLLWCAALEGTGIPWVYSEHNDPKIIQTERWNMHERSAALVAADRIHLLLESYSFSVPDVARDRVRIIPNPVCIPIITGKPKLDDARVLLAMGRLAAPKQHWLLLDAFARLAPDFPQWRLDIWGDGEERSRLLGDIERLGLQGRACLHGLTATPEQQYAGADVFCIPSRHEGFPLVVIEAMSHGLPVAGFAGCAAVGGIIKPGETGLLAPEMTAQSLAGCLRPLMENANLRLRMGEHAREAAMAYDPERVFDAWESLLAESAACKGLTRLQRCLSTDEAEIARHGRLLRKILLRGDVLLRDGWLRRLLVRHFPSLYNLLKNLKNTVKSSRAWPIIRPCYSFLKNIKNSFLQ